MEWTVQKITGEVHQTHAPAAIVTQPMRYIVTQTPVGLDVTLLDEQGEEAANVFLEIGGDGKTPVLRVWDCEQGMGNDPVYERKLVLTQAQPQEEHD